MNERSPNERSASDAVVLFGASGDLAYKKLFPALFDMCRRNRLNVAVIGVGRSQWTLDDFKARVHDSVRREADYDAGVAERLLSRIGYVDGDYRDPGTFLQLRDTLNGATRPLHYLAVPPSLFATVLKGLQIAGCTAGARVVVEKPFGRDLKSAVELNGARRGIFLRHASGKWWLSSSDKVSA